MSISLDRIVDVEVNITPVTGVTNNFNVGCIIDTYTDDTNRTDLHKTSIMLSAVNFSSELLEKIGSNSDYLYKQVETYFMQSPRPSKLLVCFGKIGSGEGEFSAPVDAYNHFKDEGFYTLCFSNSFISDDEFTSSTALAEVRKISAAVEANKNPQMFFVSTTLVNITSLKAGKYERTFAFVSNDDTIDDKVGTTVSSAMTGIVAGLNTLREGSAYSVAYKQLKGVKPENISETELTSIIEANGNVFANFADTYSFVYDGRALNDIRVDELYMIDVCKVLIQNAVVNTLINSKKIPQTDSGVNIITNSIVEVCNRLYEIGMISGGIWRGSEVNTLQPGDAVDNGYYVYAAPIASQTTEERLSRISPPIYIALLSSGAIEHVVISVNVVR